MSRYISVDWLMDYFADDIDYYGKYVRDDIEDNMPTIDIVRCKECKYCVNDQCWKSDGLDKLDGNVADDDFCSRGEREDE